MNKAEKQLAKKVLAYFSSSPKTDAGFTREENIILERWRVHKIINEDAFQNMTSMSADHKEYIQTLNYPFTAFGDEEIRKDWYLRFRNSKGIIIVRDILTVIAFLVSLYLAIAKIFQK
jgi:hypothetical protein